MQKVLTLALLAATVQFSHAQSPLKAGTVALGGGINYTHNGEEVTSGSGYYNNSSSYSNNTLTLSPAVSYFVADNLSIGVDLNYSIQETMYKYNSGNSTPTYRDYTSLRLGPFVRYYKLLNDQFGFTGTLGAGYERDSQPTSTNIGNSTTLKSNGFYAALTPGIIFLPIPKLGIGASIGGLGYSRLNVKPENTTNSDYSDVASTFGANFGLAQLTFSGTYFFGR
ncbi:MAG: hypothetical protein EOO56_20995 [Hymenobacter sp.]|nr:MAG: hypothetical protein EOO56_20995 [Hymenobacter sp.]